MGNNMAIIQVELCHIHPKTKRVLQDTNKKYRDIVSYLIHVICDHHSEILPLEANEQLKYIEKLVHLTKENPNPKYKDFDLLFYKFPSYLRRSAIRDAIGHVQSHETRCDQYEEERNKLVAKGIHYKKMEPVFNFQPNVWPTLYKKQSLQIYGKNISIKAFVNQTWEWIDVSIPNRDYKNLLKASNHGKLKNPTLVYKYHKFYLIFPVAYKTKKIPKTDISAQHVMGVDLGLNHSAVCSVIDANGTVHGRMFAPFKENTDRINHLINKIRKASRISGKGQSLSSLYTKLQGQKENYVKQLSRWIVNQAVAYGCYGIVLEHLSWKKKKKKSIASRIHHWCTAKIRDYIKGMAFREGIRTFIINPKNTSALAFDGSGKVERDNDNYSLCTFSSRDIMLIYQHLIISVPVISFGHILNPFRQRNGRYWRQKFLHYRREPIGHFLHFGNFPKSWHEERPIKAYIISEYGR